MRVRGKHSQRCEEKGDSYHMWKCGGASTDVSSADFGKLSRQILATKTGISLGNNTVYSCRGDNAATHAHHILRLFRASHLGPSESDPTG